jgi:hypothetical protein
MAEQQNQHQENPMLEQNQHQENPMLQLHNRTMQLVHKQDQYEEREDGLLGNINRMLEIKKQQFEIVTQDILDPQQWKEELGAGKENHPSFRRCRHTIFTKFCSGCHAACTSS